MGFNLNSPEISIWKSEAEQEISGFYSQDGHFFYGAGEGIKEVSADEMVKRMEIVSGLEFSGLEFQLSGSASP